LHGRKVYLAVNTLLKDAEIARLVPYLRPLYERGLDAVIVQDVGVLETVHREFPDLAIHASTQMCITNREGAQFLMQQGVERVVPARELSLEEVRHLATIPSLEIECFVHGALCYSYSGQCLLSSLIGGRSGNRGQCAQPCRLVYGVGSKSSSFLSLKDICTLEDLPDLLDAGVMSLKIEGRMKKPEYVALTTKLYHKYVNLYLEKGRAGYRVDPKDIEQLMDLYNRGGFSQGYYKQHNGKSMITSQKVSHAGVPAVRVKAQRGRTLEVEALTEIQKGDLLDLSEAGSERTYKDNYTFGAAYQVGEIAQLSLGKGYTYAKGQVLYRIRNQSLIDSLQKDIIEQPIKEPISGICEVVVGQPLRMQVQFQGQEVRMESEVLVQEASKQPIDEERLRKQLCKTGNTPFFFESLSIQMDANAFLPMQAVNELRRKILEKLEDTVCKAHWREYSPQNPTWEIVSEKEASQTTLSVLVEDLNQMEAVLADGRAKTIYLDLPMDTGFFHNERLQRLCASWKAMQKELFVAFPYILRKETSEFLAKHWNAFQALSFDGILVRNYESVQFLRDFHYTGEIRTDFSLYVWNQRAKSFWEKQGIARDTAPLELSFRELKERNLANSELVIYGHLPAMISAQCIQKTTDRCTKQAGVLPMTDRLGKTYHVRNQCAYCYNVVYDCHALNLLDLSSELSTLSPRQVRMQFSYESPEEVTRYLKYFYAKEKAVDVAIFQDKKHTRGHFATGIV
jgi:putative protease